MSLSDDSRKIAWMLDPRHPSQYGATMAPETADTLRQVMEDWAARALALETCFDAGVTAFKGSDWAKSAQALELELSIPAPLRALDARVTSIAEIRRNVSARLRVIPGGAA